MLRIVFSLGIVAVLSFNLYGSPTKCAVFTPVITDASSSYADATIETEATTDYGSLKNIYGCILDNSKKIGAATSAQTAADYEEVIKTALVLENTCANYDSVLLKCSQLIGSKSETFAQGVNTKARITSLTRVGNAVLALGSKARTLASGTYALSTQDTSTTPDLKTKLSSWEKDDTGALISLDGTTLLYSLDKANAANKTATELSTTLKDDVTDVNDFKTKLKNKAYDVTVPDLSSQAESALGASGANGASGTNGASGATASDNKNNNNNLMDAFLAQYIKNLSNSNTTTNNNNAAAATAPVLGGDKDKGTGSGGGAGALAGASLANRSGSDDDERKELIAKAKEREKTLIRMDVQRTLYGSNPNGKLLSANKLAGTSSGGSLRDIFAKRFDDADKALAKKGETPSIFGGDKEDTSQNDEKYKGYFKGGAAPASLSAKDIALNRFTDMYETARLNALTEDADQEFAGRYIDLFLLIHTILDHEYRDKGKLMDITEVLPSPLGPKPYKQHP